MRPLPDVHRDALAATGRIVGGIKPDQLHDATPCEDYDVAGLLNHLIGGNFWVATLRNISAHGLQLEGDDLPSIGAYVTLFIEGLNIPPGEVVWKRGRLAGVEVIEELSWTSIIPWIRAIVRSGAN